MMDDDSQAGMQQSTAIGLAYRFVVSNHQGDVLVLVEITDTSKKNILIGVTINRTVPQRAPTGPEPEMSD